MKWGRLILLLIMAQPGHVFCPEMVTERPHLLFQFPERTFDPEPVTVQPDDGYRLQRQAGTGQYCPGTIGLCQHEPQLLVQLFYRGYTVSFFGLFNSIPHKDIKDSFLIERCLILYSMEPAGTDDVRFPGGSMEKSNIVLQATEYLILAAVSTSFRSVLNARHWRAAPPDVHASMTAWLIARGNGAWSHSSPAGARGHGLRK